jgi:aminoglycoside 3-N-acetyltransferase
MQTVNREQLTNLIRTLGVQAGDGLLVHSAIQYLGKPQGGIGLYLDALCEVLDIDLTISGNPAKPGSGTLAVPAFNFGFAQGESFDPFDTPSHNMGAFSELVRQHPDALRTPHPLQSLAVIGYYADDLAARDTPSAFDPGSVFERMLELNFKILLLGADVQAISALHYSEQRAQVPYRYWKDFSGQVNTSEGWQSRTYRMYARDMTSDPQIDLHPVQALLESRGQWQALPLNYGRISLCEMRLFVEAVDEFLQKDPWSLVINRPDGV